MMNVAHNLASLFTYASVKKTGGALEKSIKKLSSGLRINSASDDAAGLAISEKMRAQTRGLAQAIQNSQDGISLIQTAGGALSETHSVLQRMRELSVQAANDTLTQGDRAAIQLEMGELREEINHIANATQFNRKKLLNGDAAALWSSDRPETKAVIKGGLRTIDSFGQKSSAEGNYNLDIQATAGQGQVQKSEIMIIKHPNVITDVRTNTTDGITAVRVDNVPAGDYTIKAEKPAKAGAKIVGSYGFGPEKAEAIVYFAGRANTPSATNRHFQMLYTPTDGGEPSTVELDGGPATSTIYLAQAVIQDKIDADPNLRGKITVGIACDWVSGGTGNPNKPGYNHLIFTAMDGTLDFTGTSKNGFGYGYSTPPVGGLWDPAPTEKYHNIPGFTEMLTGGIPDAADYTGSNDLTLYLTLTDAEGNPIESNANLTDPDPRYRYPHVLLKDIPIVIDTNMSGAVDPARAMADTINKKLEETSLIAPSSKIYRGITLSGFVTAGVDDLGNLTLTSSVGHIEVSGALKEVLGIPTQRSQKRQVVEDLLVMNADRAKNNASILFEVTSAANGAVTVKATSNVLTTDGRMENYVRDNIVLFTGDGVANAVKLGGLLGEDDEDFTLALDEGVISSFFDIGSKFVCNVTGAGIDDRTANMSVTVEATQDPDWPDRWEENWTDNGGNVKGAPVSERLTYNLNAEAAANKDLPFRNFYVNSDNGTVYEGNVVVTTNDNFTLDETRYQPTMMTTKIGVRNSSEITGSEAFKIKVGDSEFTYNTAWGWEGSDWRKNDSHNDLFAQHLYAALQAAIEDGSLKNVSISMSGQTLMIESPFGEEITIDTTGSPHYTSSVTSVPANPPFTFTGNIHDSDRLAGFTAAYVGKIGTDEVRLRDLSAFWDSQGNFLLDDPQTLTITQGDGKTARVTLYANDTLEETRARLNNAIANGLGQAKYDPGRDDNFCSFVEKTPGVPMPSNGLESVAGTFVFRSLIPGAAGELSFSGSEEILNALGLNTIQEATENQFTVSVRDAHTGRAVMSGVKVTGNLLIDIPTDNVDTEIDIMAGITAEWDDAQKRFTYTTKAYSTTLHLSDNTTVFQVGANEGEDLAIHIGDMSAHALGLDRVDVSTRDRATRSITVIDSAIDRVSTQRARLGAYQNRLEHTISNLTTEDENLTAAESRIRDADMAREMMHFSRLQIILQAGNSMLAQANQLPQNVLSLVR